MIKIQLYYSNYIVAPLSVEQRDWLIDRKIKFKFESSETGSYLELREEDAFAFLLTFPYMNSTGKLR